VVPEIDHIGLEIFFTRCYKRAHISSKVWKV